MVMLRTAKVGTDSDSLDRDCLGAYFDRQNNRLRNVAQAIDEMLTHDVVGEVREATSW